MNRSVRSLVFLILLALGVGGCSSSNTAEEYVAFAESFRERGELELAVAELKNALRQSPDSLDARWMLGSIYLDTGDGEGAEKELRRCADLGMDYNQIVVPLMEAQLQQNKYQEVIDTLFDEPSMADADLMEVWRIRGAAFLRLKKLEAADEAFDNVLVLAPTSAEGLLGKARVAANRDSFEKAKSWLDKVFESDPAFAPAWSFLGDIEQFQQNPQGAEDAYTKALESRPDDVYDLSNRALMRILQNELLSATEDFQAARRGNATLKNKQPLVLYVQGQLNLKRDKNEFAAVAFDSMLEVAPDYLPARFFLAVAHYKLGNIEQAEQSLNMFRAKAPKYIAGHRLYAALKFSQGNYREARDILENLLSFHPNDAWSLALLADVAVLEGNPQESVENYRRIVELHPDSESAHLKLALGLMMQDQAAARKELAKIAESEQNATQARMLTLVSHLNSRDWDSAIATGKKLIEEQPGNWDAYTLLGGAHVGNGDSAQARTLFTRALELNPGNPNAANNLASMELREGNPAAARTLYESVLEQHPNEVSTLLGLSTLDERQGKFDEALTRLEAAVGKNPNDVSMRVALARLYLRTGQPSRNLSLVYEAKGEQATDPRILEVLVLSQLALGEYSSALNNAKKLVTANPESAQARYNLAEAYLRSDRGLEAVEQLDKVVELKPDHFGASVMRVRVQRKSNRLAEAVKLLDEIDPAYADRPEVLIETGWLMLYEKKYSEAITAFQAAFEKLPSGMLAIQVGIARWNAGMESEAIAGYKQWLEKNPEDVQVRFHLANSYMQLDEKAKAIETYKAILKVKDGDAVILNNIAWLLRESDPKEALKWAQRAVEASPDWPPALDTLGMLQMDSGEVNTAHRTFEKAAKLAPNDRELRYHLAMALSKMGEESQAVLILKALLTDSSEFPGKPEAETLLQTLNAKG